MTSPYGGSAFLNAAIFPNQLYTAYGSTYNGQTAAVVNMTQINLDRYLHRILLTTTLTASDMLGGSGGAYWDTTKTPPVQAPFYLFLANMATSNIIDLSLIGSVNVGEYMAPILIPANTEVWGVWPGVLQGSADKCQMTMYCSGSPVQ